MSTSAFVQAKLTIYIVWFLYPETANVRLEEMDTLFGDATTAMPTPAQEAEVEALMSASRSPVPSLDIRRPGGFTADNAIPGLDINPPDEVDTKSGSPKNNETGEGIGGWISRMVKRNTGDKGDRGDTGAYRRLGQDDD